MNSTEHEVLQTDVLVVGGGSAGLRAAIEARKSGREVTLVSKGKAGKSGNSLYAGGFSAAVDEPDMDAARDAHYQDTLRAGGSLNQRNLARRLVDEAEDRIHDLENIGIHFYRRQGQLVRGHPPGHSRPRMIYAVRQADGSTSSGLGHSLPLRRAAVAAGVNLVDQTVAYSLLRSDDGVMGVAAFSVQSGRLFHYHTPATILATGGAGQIYANTGSAGGVTGDAYALALEVGAELQDLEFVQFFPAQIQQPILTTYKTAIFGDGAVLRDGSGERIMARWDPERMEMATRDIVARAVFSELSQGNPVFLDCRQVPRERLETDYRDLTTRLAKHGVQLGHDQVSVAPSAHFFMGGIGIDNNGATSVSGLFAAGEACGGIHGANRLDGNAATETQVFGHRVGRAAAEWACRHASPSVHGTEVAPLPRRHGSDAASGRGLNALRAQLVNAMWRHAGVVRNRQSLQEMQSIVGEIGSELRRIEPPSVADQVRWCELRSMCLVAECLATAALAREESRGAHYRDDFSQQNDDEYLGHIVVNLDGGVVRTELVPLTRPDTA